MFTLLITCCAKAEPSYPPFLEPETTYSTPTREQKMWALATCAILTESNKGRNDLLGGCQRTPKDCNDWQKGLANWWGVHNRADFLERLKWIETGGHRRSFDEIASFFTSATPDQIVEIKRKYANNPQISNQIEIVLKYKDEFGQKSIAAWDFARYVALCGWGYVAGYLTEEEAWQHIMPAARLMQRTFVSWEDLGKNHVVGREFWSFEQTQKRGDLTRSCYEKLLTCPSSPWVKIPWDLDLSEEKGTN
jgi:hypothetical protein